MDLWDFPWLSPSFSQKRGHFVRRLYLFGRRLEDLLQRQRWSWWRMGFRMDGMGIGEVVAKTHFQFKVLLWKRNWWRNKKQKGNPPSTAERFQVTVMVMKKNIILYDVVVLNFMFHPPANFFWGWEKPKGFSNPSKPPTCQLGAPGQWKVSDGTVAKPVGEAKSPPDRWLS